MERSTIRSTALETMLGSGCNDPVQYGTSFTFIKHVWVYCRCLCMFCVCHLQ